MPKVTIDGQEYDADQLSESAKSQLASIQFADQKITQLQQELALATRNAYFTVLKSELKSIEITSFIAFCFTLLIFLLMGLFVFELGLQ